ncbi:o-succinylbenzoate--CoA ligase [Endozoicomonas sp. (ex Bugula neritina AB1)]|nr:o-succinylbenzoate--CoA ligase [Endozoicomonas sp. (ex Bugula neritina AB1)]
MNHHFPPGNECPLRYHAQRMPDAIALLLDQHLISYQQLDGWVERCRELLQRKGVTADQHLAVMTDSIVGTVLLSLACLRLGCVFCPINPAFPDEQKRAYCKNIDAVAVMHSSEVVFDVGHVAETVNHSFIIHPDALMNLIATSGTSGLPKAVAHSYSNHYFSAIGSHSKTPLFQGDCWLLSLPLYHVGGLAIVMRCVMSGATMAIDSEKKPLNRLLSMSRISHLSLVNTQLYRLLKMGVNFYKAGVRYILLGGGMASPVLVDQVLKQGVTLLTTYGMTEMGSQVCTGKPLFAEAGVTSGDVLPEREICLAESGEILVRGKPLALGYYRNGIIESVVDDQGWYHSGDKGCWFQEQLQVTGRMDNLFISGGENIHPEEIEQALLTLPEIIQAVVVAEFSEEFGQRPVAYVQIDEGDVDEAFTKKRLAGKIARFKIPDRIRPFPHKMTQPGIKVNRRFFQQLNDSWIAG